MNRDSSYSLNRAMDWLSSSVALPDINNEIWAGTYPLIMLLLYYCSAVRAFDNE